MRGGDGRAGGRDTRSLLLELAHRSRHPPPTSQSKSKGQAPSQWGSIKVDREVPSARGSGKVNVGRAQSSGVPGKDSAQGTLSGHVRCGQHRIVTIISSSILRMTHRYSNEVEAEVAESGAALESGELAPSCPARTVPGTGSHTQAGSDPGRDGGGGIPREGELTAGPGCLPSLPTCSRLRSHSPLTRAG